MAGRTGAPRPSYGGFGAGRLHFQPHAAGWHPYVMGALSDLGVGSFHVVIAWAIAMPKYAAASAMMMLAAMLSAANR